MTTQKDYLAALKLFNEKAEKLANLSFIQELTAPNTGVTIAGKQQDDGTVAVTSELRGPSQEAVDAFVLTFRFFIQNNERSSLRNIAAVYDSAPLDKALKDRFRSARDSINKLLDSPNLGNIKHNDVHPTNREIMDVFIYGGLAHASPNKHELFRQWMAFPPAAVLFQNTFTLILGNLLQGIMYITRLNQKAIQQLSAKDGS